MHRYRVWLLAAVLCLAIAAPAAAWEFLMDGAFTWEYDYRSQSGSSGFFGPYDQDAGSGIGGAGAGFFAPINGWLGAHTASNGNEFVSGSDASWNVFYMSTNMELRMNPALRVRGNYYIGEWLPTDRAGFHPQHRFRRSATWWHPKILTAGRPAFSGPFRLDTGTPSG